MGIRGVAIFFIGFLFCGQIWAQEEEERPERAPDYKFNVMITGNVPILMSGRLQREAFRGLIATDLIINYRLAKNVYIGAGGQYGVFQTVNPNDYKIKNRNILQHHFTPGISLGYEYRLKTDQRFSFYMSAFAGYTFFHFSGLGYGFLPNDSAFYAPVGHYYNKSAFMFSPQISFFMNMDDQYSSVIGFTIGANISPFSLRKRDIYLSKIENGVEISNDSYFVNVPDGGITSYFKIGIVFMQRFKKVKKRLNNYPG